VIGGLAGSALGVWGAIFGITAGIMVPKGKGRTAVRILMYPMLVLAIATLTVATIALNKDQPRSVWYPLMLLGGILLLQLAWLVPFLELTLRKVEKKKLEAEELRRS
jgi:peptidoglycan/LPS O-acetylase OafA/YrhL